MEIDLGDAVLAVGLRVKGRRDPSIRWKIGVPRDAMDVDREQHTPPAVHERKRVDLVMDLMADQQVPLNIEFTDEMGNPTGSVEGATIAFSTDAPDIINVIDNGDGSARAVAMGPLGSGNVRAEVQVGGKTMTGDLMLNVVAGLAERVNIVAGTPEEATPDDAEA